MRKSRQLYYDLERNEWSKSRQKISKQFIINFLLEIRDSGASENLTLLLQHW